jgi:hypothetical protein
LVEAAKQAPAQWYSIKPLHNDILSLVDLLEVLAENLQAVLKKAGFGKLRDHDKLFNFLPSKFDNFRAEFMIQDTCETTQRCVKGLKTKQWFIRLGTQYYSGSGTKSA